MNSQPIQGFDSFTVRPLQSAIIHLQWRIRQHSTVSSGVEWCTFVYCRHSACPSPSKLKVPAPPENMCIFLYFITKWISNNTHTHYKNKETKNLITPSLKITRDEPPDFLGPARHQSHSLKVQKDLFKSSELCCSTGCYLLLSALSQWIGLRFSKHISCPYFEH